MAQSTRPRISLPGEAQQTLGKRLARAFRPGVALAVVFALTAAVALVQYGRHRDRTRRTLVAIAQVKDAVQRFRTDVGRCPQTPLEILHPPAGARRYLTFLPNDGWGRPLHVQCPGYFDPQTVDVISAGPSGSLTQDDNIQ